MRLAVVSETPTLDAQILLAHVLGTSRAWVLAHSEASLSSAQEQALRGAMDRLEGGEPLPYILGHWEFFGLDFIVSPDVLIPRPETELLVERALEWLRLHPRRRCIADIGTGSGCIAVSLATNLPDAYVLATDASQSALEIAKLNAEKHEVSKRIRLLQADLLNLQPSCLTATCLVCLSDLASARLEGNPGERQEIISLQLFDLIVANLPYIPTSRLESLAVARHEPRLALDGGPDGLDAIRNLLPAAARWLAPGGGCCLLEIDSEQGDTARNLAKSIFSDAEVLVIPDLAGLDRLLVVETTGLNTT